MSRENATKLDLISIFVTLIGVVIIIFAEEIGLTIIFTGILLYAVTIVRARLHKMGAEQFALGSIIVWLGFLTAALPVIAYAWSLFRLSLQLTFFIIGIVLIILGFTIESFDLNKKFYKMIKTTYARLSDLTVSAKSSFFRSVWTALSIIFLIWGVISIFVPSIISFLPLIIPSISWSRTALLFFLSIIFLLIEFRKIILLLLESFLESVSLIITAILDRLRHFPDFIRKVIDLIKSSLASISSILSSFVIFSLYNSFLFSFAGFLFTGYFALRFNDSVYVSISIVLLILTLVSVIQQRQEQISAGIGRIQQATYLRTLRLKNLVRRQASGACPQCGVQIEGDTSTCPNCNFFLPNCMVCKSRIYQGEDILSCVECETAGHAEHVENWINIRSVCPHCRVEWK